MKHRIKQRISRVLTAVRRTLTHYSRTVTDTVTRAVTTRLARVKLWFDPWE